MLDHFLILNLIFGLSFAFHNQTVCKYETPDENNRPFPSLPTDFFSSHVQVNLIPNKTTIDVVELFDAVNKRAVIVETEATGPAKNISLTGRNLYMFDRNELITVIPIAGQPASCAVTDLDSSDDRFMFGERASSATGFSVNSAFRVHTNPPPIYKGAQKLESGIDVEMWQSCVYMPSYDATVIVKWYFTAATWTASLGTPYTPARITVEGFANKPYSRPVKNIYTFIAFRDYFTDYEQHLIQVPQGTVCPFMKDFADNKPLPIEGLDGAFSFMAEVVNQDGVITGLNERVDTKLSLSRYDYKPQSLGMFTSPWGDNPIKEIHDFNTGHSYVVDKVLGNCTIQAIQGDSFDSEWVDETHVRMRTIAEFFGLTNINVNWTYTGQRMVRDVMADMYIAERIGWPSTVPPDTKSIWEMAFASEDYIQSAGTIFQQRELIRLWISIPSINYKVVYNIYNFDAETPDAAYFDVAECFVNNQKRLVTFNLPGSVKELVKSNLKEFQYYVLLSMILYTGVLPIRISRIQFEDDGDDLMVRLHLLDAPTIEGSMNSKVTALSTDDIIAKLKENIDAGTFQVLTSNSLLDDVKALTVIKNSLKTTPVIVNTQTIIQLDSGAAAGAAIGCILGGLLLGLLIIFILNKVKGQGSLQRGLSFAPKTFEDKS